MILAAASTAHQRSISAKVLFLRYIFRRPAILLRRHAGLCSFRWSVIEFKFAKALTAHITHRHCTVHVVQCAATGIHPRIKNSPFITQLHFQFSRMNIYIHLGRIYPQVNNTPRELAHHDMIAVAFFHRCHDSNTLYIAIIDEKVFHAAGGTAALRAGQVTANADKVAFALHRD